MKTCNKCSKEKPYSEFHKHAVMKDGYNYTCKKCRSIENSNNPKCSVRSLKWRTANPERFKMHCKKAQKNPTALNRKHLRKRLNEKLKNPTARYSRSISCSSQFLKTYIAAQFSPEMSWENKNILWELDHIIPLSAFELNDPLQRKAANHYSNIRPILISDNQTKHTKHCVKNKIEFLWSLDLAATLL